MNIFNIFKKKKHSINVDRVEADLNFGLNDEQVDLRIKEKLTNKTKKIVGKSYPEIFIKNLCSFYNILLCIIAILLIYGGQYFSLFFIAVRSSINQRCFGLQCIITKNIGENRPRFVFLPTEKPI